MYIQWNKKYETGQPLIDAEHRLLVMLFRKLDVGIKTRQPDAVIARIVLEVRKFVEFHFVSEENLMRETGYPQTDSHRTIHAELLLVLSAMTGKLASHREYPEDLLDFLSTWLVEHIAGHDQQVAQHIRASRDRPIAELVYAEYLLPSQRGNLQGQEGPDGAVDDA